MAKKPTGFGVPKNDLYGKTKQDAGNPLPKMARMPAMPKLPKLAQFAKRVAAKK